MSVIVNARSHYGLMQLMLFTKTQFCPHQFEEIMLSNRVSKR